MVRGEDLRVVVPVLGTRHVDDPGLGISNGRHPDRGVQGGGGL